MRNDPFTELFLTYQPSLYRYLYRLCGSKEWAEELLQETFYRAMLSLRQEDALMARAWLFKVARNLFIDSLRKRGRDAELLQEIGRRASGVSPSDLPEEALDRKEQRRKITEVMNRLPERERTLLYLREIEQFSYQELAAALDLSMNHVKVLLHRSRQRFRELAEQWERGAWQE